MKYLLHLLLFLPLLAAAQSGDMRVYTVAGWYPQGTVTVDGTPATNAKISATEGVWMDNDCYIYFTDNFRKIRKVDLATGLIYTVAGTSSPGFSGDGGPATSAEIKAYGLWVDETDNVFIADAGNNRVRKINAVTGIITTVAGGGSVLGDGGPATAAMLYDPPNVYGDKAGNLYIGERTRVRKVDTTGIITTIAGTGVGGLSGDGGLATNAQVYNPTTMLLDGMGNLLFADRGNCRIRKVNLTTGIITTVAGSTAGYSGDGGLATNAQLTGPLSFAIDKFDNIIIGDNGSNYIRFVDAVTGIITTVGGVGIGTIGDIGEGALVTALEIHPEFFYLDLDGNLFYSNFGKQIRKITNFNPAKPFGVSDCRPVEVKELSSETSSIPCVYPNPATSELYIRTNTVGKYELKMVNMLGQQVLECEFVNKPEVQLSLSGISTGNYIVALSNRQERFYYKIIVNKN